MDSEPLLSKKTAMVPTSNVSVSSTTSIDDLPLPTDSPFAVDSPEFWRYITAVRSVRASHTHVMCVDVSSPPFPLCRRASRLRRLRPRPRRSSRRCIVAAMTCTYISVPTAGRRIGSTSPWPAVSVTATTNTTLMVFVVKGYEKFAGLFSSLGGIRSIMDREVETKFIEKMNSFGSRELHQLNVDSCCLRHCIDVERLCLAALEESVRLPQRSISGRRQEVFANQDRHGAQVLSEKGVLAH